MGNLQLFFIIHKLTVPDTNITMNYEWYAVKSTRNWNLVSLNLRRKRLIINDYLITQAAPLVQIFFPGLAEVGGQVFQMGKDSRVDFATYFTKAVTF